ncbi:unnamed protein product [Linum tenue]|uniref:Uncharacterized protein n=1 Tax=Linum tenue TaxID=586396 RepID=A0AAV0PH82_9ROSI|nr:unnamed protein product [Linum tenue]
MLHSLSMGLMVDDRVVWKSPVKVMDPVSQMIQTKRTPPASILGPKEVRSITLLQEQERKKHQKITTLHHLPKQTLKRIVTAAIYAWKK